MHLHVWISAIAMGTNPGQPNGLRKMSDVWNILWLQPAALRHPRNPAEISPADPQESAKNTCLLLHVSEIAELFVT